METQLQETAPSVLIVTLGNRPTQNWQPVLAAQGFQAWNAACRQDISRLLPGRSWSLVLLDIANAQDATLARCAEICRLFDGPVAVVSSQLDDLDRVQVLQIGVDEEIPWPIHPALLGARLKNLLRRGRSLLHRQTAPVPPLQIGTFRLDRARQEARYQERLIALTPLELDLLDLLAQHAGQPVSREVICAALRGLPHDMRDRSIDLRISRLRKKLGDDDHPARLLLTVRGVGYQLAADPL